MLSATAHLNEGQIEDLYQLYQLAWWAKHRQRNDIRRMLEHTDEIIALVEPDQRLVAFARVLTDYVYRATVYDVIVKDSDRGQGVGRQLLETIVNHPALQSVEAIYLTCLPDIVPFYEKWGFKTEAEQLLMKRTHFPTQH